MDTGKGTERLDQAAILLAFPYCRFDPGSLRLLGVNRELSDALGYSFNELHAMTLEEILRPEDVAGFRAALEALGTSFANAGLWRLRRASGECWPVDIRWRRLANGEGPEIFATLHDASGRAALQSRCDAQDLRLRECDTTLHLARRMLDIGTWKMEVETGQITWSRGLQGTDDEAAEDFSGDIDAYLATVHPDDRAALIANFQDFRHSDATHFEFRHRVLGREGETFHVRGEAFAESHGAHRVLIGVFQDFTDEVLVRNKLSEASRMQRIAGRMARMGAWRAELDPPRVTWSPETAAIHEEPEGTTSSIEDGINYYAPEHRARITEVFTACARDGRPYDEVLQIVTAKGKRVWVRTIGEAVRDDQGHIVAVQGAFQDISELIAARNESENLSRRLRETLESISDAFILLDHEWRFLFVNAQAERLVGRRREDLLGKSYREEFPEAVGTIVQREFERALESGKPVRFRNFYPPLETWFEVDAEPTPEGLAIYFRDVTQEQAREERLRLLETAVSRQGDMLLITEAEPIDAPGGPKIVYVNEAFIKRTGYSRDEAIGATPRMLQGPKTDRAELDRIRQALEKWRPVRAELINYTKAGEEFWLELDIAPIADGTGWYTHFVSVERDITERKRAEEELRLNQERFQLITKATNDVIWDWDLTTGAQWGNENLKKVLGHDPMKSDRAIDTWQNRIHPEDREWVVASVKAFIAGSDTYWSGEYRYRHADGRDLTVFDRSFVIRNTEGKAIRMIGSLSDVTSQREMESRLRQAQKLEAVGQLTGGVAHDFNNLLTVILGNAEMLAEKLGDQEDLRRLADMSAAAAERGAELTSRLLAFSRKQALQPRVLDVSSRVYGMEELLRRTLPESIDLRIARAAGLWQVAIDASQLESALLNLALNARDAMPDGGRLTIEMANAALDDDDVATEPDLMPGQYVMIAVTDTGHGISPEALLRIFEPFFTTKKVGKGTGLGLSMVYGFVKQSNGHIRVYSEPREGTCVKLYFPRSYDVEAGQEADVRDDRIIGGTESILVVEDDRLVREHLVARLEGMGYRVTAAETGPQALDALKQTPDIDLLLTDIVLPGGMNGRVLADTARGERPDLKVLFTSGYSENAIVHHGRLDPGVELLGKPYRRDQLAAKVRKVLDKA
ncbi:PAS domain S-box protein [Pararhodobacter sp. SW119]|uniref:PAS domain S-box protein n=1 Tax=Pararhodobacter sp. SW119 TaxID=2780075 RepID=UPI001ADF7E7B|nr:PAS domain S-box protein [Pararhodobacter sp. SW119]